jgi:hypothetical protein
MTLSLGKSGRSVNPAALLCLIPQSEVSTYTLFVYRFGAVLTFRDNFRHAFSTFCAQTM